MTSDSPDSNTASEHSSGAEPETSPFVQQVTPLLADLLYPSESDEPIDVVQTYLKMAESLTVSHIKEWLMLPPSSYVAEMPEAEFWEPVVTMEAWFGEEEKASATRFQQLKDLVEATLTDRQVFRVGQTEIDVYLLGKPTQGARVGLKTKVVET